MFFILFEILENKNIVKIGHIIPGYMKLFRIVI